MVCVKLWCFIAKHNYNYPVVIKHTHTCSLNVYCVEFVLWLCRICYLVVQNMLSGCAEYMLWFCIICSLASISVGSHLSIGWRGMTFTLVRLSTFQMMFTITMTLQNQGISTFYNRKMYATLLYMWTFWTWYILKMNSFWFMDSSGWKVWAFWQMFIDTANWIRKQLT